MHIGQRGQLATCALFVSFGLGVCGCHLFETNLALAKQRTVLVPGLSFAFVLGKSFDVPGLGHLVLFFALACGFGFQRLGFGFIELCFDGFAFFRLIDKLPNGMFQSRDIAIRTELDGCVGFWEKHDTREGKTRQQKDIDTCAENVVCFHL